VAGVTPADLLELTAGGFRDTTRIAAGDPNCGRRFSCKTAAPVLAALAHLGDRLAEFRKAIESADAAGLGHLLAQAKRVRDALGN